MRESIKEAFINPLDEFTPIPFWFWNDKLTEEEIVRQIQDFYEKGVNGFVIHPRIGMPKEIPYLSERFMEFVTCAVLEAKRLDMKVVLYDEAMYPSGSAHGMVVKKNKEYASKGLKMTEYTCRGEITIRLTKEEEERLVSVQAVKKISKKEILPECITKLEITGHEIHFKTKEEGWSLLLFYQTFTKGHIRGIHFGEDDGEKNAPPSADLLNKNAVEEFIRLTHDRYYEVLGEFFGDTVISIFTDEPDIMGRGYMEDLKSWTDDFLEYYIKEGSKEQDLPLLWFEGGSDCEAIRKKYINTVNKRLEETYYKPIYEWCNEHRIALTGHPHESDDIGFLKYFHIPAQDVIYRWVAPEDGLGIEGTHSTMAKCTSDSARHRGKRRNGNECFACCGKNNIEWAFSVDDMKWYMDWLFIRGVNLLYPHAFFYSVRGSKRTGERPPDVGPNNIWWPYYKQITDYIKRMSYLMTDSINLARVAVLCEAHHLPWQMVKPLYENQIEFNYLEKELLTSKALKIEDSALKIEKQTYKILVIEEESLIEEENFLILQSFLDNGGQVLVYNPSGKALGIRGGISISSFCEVVNKINGIIGREIEPFKEVKALRVSHILKENYEFFIFVNEGKEEANTKVRLHTVGAVESWDALNGSIGEYFVQEVREDCMDIDLIVNRREALILRIDKSKTPKAAVPSSEFSYAEKLILDKGWYMGKRAQNLNKLKELIPWNEIKGKEHYSGPMIYKNQFTMNENLNNKEIELDMGEVCEIVKATLNGRELGVKMWAPYRFKVTEYIKEGENVLMLEVRNTLANKINKLSLKSGLIGPVSLTVWSKHNKYITKIKERM